MKNRILVTAGPTHEPIDQVRYLANRSSGALGAAIADAAAEAGCRVTLLLGPCAAQAQRAEVRVVRFETTADLERLLDEHFPSCDVLVMAAAVADYRPTPGSARSGKLERTDKGLVLELESTPDLVKRCAAGKCADQRVIAFALEEPAQLAQRAQAKMRRKGVDAIVANPLQTMGDPGITATVYTATGQALSPGNMPKRDFAAWLVRWIVSANS